MLRRYTILCFLAAGLLSCNGNPLGDTPQSIEGFTIYTTDFQNQTDGGMKAALLEVITGSKETLNCAFSALTISDVTQALIARSRAAVKVKVAFDTDSKNGDAGSLALQASGAFVVVSTPGETTQGQLLYGNLGAGVMRHNYCMADERYIWISTAAVDDTQMAKTPAIAFKIGSPQFGLARDFLRESSMFSQLLFGYGKARTDFNTKFTALDQVIGAFWGPQEKPLDVLATNLSEATQSVEFYSTGFETTNSKKADLDVPQTLSRLETAYGVTIKKYFASQALFGVGSKAYTLSNPHQYVNNSVRASANIFVVDKGLASAKVFIYTGSLRSQANSSDDSVLIELRGRRSADAVGAYLDRIGAASTPVSNTGDASANLEVVISEIMWMGSYSNALSNDANDEFVEFYNTTSAAINMSGWKFACTTDAIPNRGTTNVNSFITLPAGALIAPGGYFVVARKNTGAFPEANHYDSDLSFTNDSRECKLTNGKATPVSTYTKQPAFTGDEIDIAGDGTAEFSSTANMGQTQGTPNFIRRSMERIDTATAGKNTTNWRTNVYTAFDNLQVASSFRDQTFASIGAVNSIPPAPPTVTNVVVTSTSPNNGTTPYNTGSTTITITGTGFASVSCPSGVKLNDLAPTTASACTVISATTITATIPAGARTNGSTGWDVIVTNAGGSNSTSTVKFVPVAGLLISEVLIGTSTSTSNEFVELYNPTATSINLQTLGGSGISMRRRTASGGTDAVLGSFTFINPTIPSHGFFLAVSGVSTAETWYAKRDATFTAALAASNIAYVSLTTNLTKALDQVGWGTISDVASGGGCEGGNTNCANLASNDNSIERKPAGGAGHATDTDNNASDFNTQNTSITPRGTVDSTQP